MAAASLVWAGAAVQPPPPYQVIAPDGSRTLVVARQSGTTDFVALDVLSRFFDLAMREDPRTEGLVLSAGAQRVVLTSGQTTVSAGGRVVALSAPVTRDGSRWLVPIEFLQVLDPLLNRRIDVRRESRLIVLDAAEVPRVIPRVERTSTGGRLTITVAPAVPAHVSRTGSQITIRFEATALDLPAVADTPADVVASITSAGPTLLVELGPSVGNVRQQELRDASRIALDLIAAPLGPRAGVPPALTPPVIERQGGIRTVVIDPGHGGSDSGTRNDAGLEEKQITLSTAQELKAALESRLGIRVILTRESDTDVAIDARAAVANTSQADLFISLHVNASLLPGMRGWQVQSLDPTDYAGSPAPEPGVAVAETVPLAGGGTRAIAIVPWQVAQMPYVDQSAVLADLLAARLAETGLPAQSAAVLKTPARVLVGANMPAVLIELGFITHGQDATELGSRGYQAKVADIITSAVDNLRAGWPSTPGGGAR